MGKFVCNILPSVAMGNVVRRVCGRPLNGSFISLSRLEYFVESPRGSWWMAWSNAEPLLTCAGVGSCSCVCFFKWKCMKKGSCFGPRSPLPLLSLPLFPFLPPSLPPLSPGNMNASCGRCVRVSDDARDPCLASGWCREPGRALFSRARARVRVGLRPVWPVSLPLRAAPPCSLARDGPTHCTVGVTRGGIMVSSLFLLTPPFHCLFLFCLLLFCILYPLFSFPPSHTFPSMFSIFFSPSLLFYSILPSLFPLPFSLLFSSLLPSLFPFPSPLPSHLPPLHDDAR